MKVFRRLGVGLLNRRGGRSQAGFTLIELLLVTSLTVILLLAVSSMLMTFLLSNARTNIMRQMQSEGDQMMSQMEFVFRGAKDLQQIDPSAGPVCTTTGYTSDLSTQLVVTEVDGTYKYLKLSPTGESVLLSDAVILDGATSPALNSSFVLLNGISIKCTQDTSSNKLSVEITFSLKRADGAATLNRSFRSFTQLRNS